MGLKQFNYQIRRFVNQIKPNVMEGGKFQAFRSLFEGFETFLFVPNDTAKSGSNIHDSFDSKRLMIMVVIALVPAMLFGMYNIGYQNLAVGAAYGVAAKYTGFWATFAYGFLAYLPNFILAYATGLAIEFTVAQWKGEEIHEGFLVTGFIIPLIIPVTTPWWIVVIATAFAVIFAKEIFGGTGMNIFNVALIARAFIFFAYPSVISGDSVWVLDHSIFGLGCDLPDGATCATPLGLAATTGTTPAFDWNMVWGFIPGSIGETSIIAIALGAILLIATGIASWKTTFSVFLGGALTALLYNKVGNPDNAMVMLPWYQHLVLGGFAFGACFMATDPVTSARTETGKWIYGFLIGMMAIVIRVANPGYPEGMMLAILLMNLCAPLIDYCVYQANISKRAKRVAKK